MKIASLLFQPLLLTLCIKCVPMQGSIANKAHMLRTQPSFDAGAAAVRSSDGGTEETMHSRTLKRDRSMGAADPFAELVIEVSTSSA